MGQLGDKQIKDTYDGIIKTQDEGPISSTPKRLQDGTGNNLPVDVTTSKMRYYGEQDFSNATVSGIAGAGEANTASNVGTGDGVFKQKVGVDLQFKSLKAGSNVTLTESANEIEIAATVPPSGVTSITTNDGISVSPVGGTGDVTLSNTLDGNNLGAGEEIFVSKTGADLNFKSLVAGSNITLTTNADEIEISASGGGGGATEASTYMMYPMAPYTQGYGDTYANTTYPIYSEAAYWDRAIDQNDLTLILGKYEAAPGIQLDKWIIPVFDNFDFTTYNLYVYDCYPGTGAPRNQVHYQQFVSTGLGNNWYLEVPTTFTPTVSNLWFGLQWVDGGAQGGSAKAAMLSRRATLSNFVSYGGWGTGGGAVVGLLGINSLYFYDGNPVAPATLLENQQYGHRDEMMVAMYKTVNQVTP